MMMMMNDPLAPGYQPAQVLEHNSCGTFGRHRSEKGLAGAADIGADRKPARFPRSTN